MLYRIKTIIFFSIVLVTACGKPDKKKGNSIEFISEIWKQESIFQNLLVITNDTIPEISRKDSLAFLVLPVQASCPACRKKAIDSIVKNQNNLLPNHYIILCANGGRKTINSYFKEEDAELPIIANRLFLDSTNEAHKYELYYDKPTIYYTYNRKAYKKVAAIPATVREDLREFFSGYRNVKQ